jgi:hypothetical protein
MAQAGTSAVEQMIAAGLIHKQHKISESDLKALNSLSPTEVKALSSIRAKLGDSVLKKVHKGGRFPHPASSSF